MFLLLFFGDFEDFHSPAKTKKKVRRKNNRKIHDVGRKGETLKIFANVFQQAGVFFWGLVLVLQQTRYLAGPKTEKPGLG